MATYRALLEINITFKRLRAPVKIERIPRWRSVMGILLAERLESLFSSEKPKRRREQLYDQMLAVIARDLVPERPHRSEPRVKKRRPKTYQLMTAPPGQMKVSKSRRNK